MPRLRLVENQDFTFAPGVEVTEIEQVKGLEFDYVILVEVSAAQLPRHARARAACCTSAPPAPSTSSGSPASRRRARS